MVKKTGDLIENLLPVMREAGLVRISKAKHCRGARIHPHPVSSPNGASNDQSGANLDLGNQDSMNWTLVGYLYQSALLLLGELPSERDSYFDSVDHPGLCIALSTILGMDSRI
jgi:hypothetical protein